MPVFAPAATNKVLVADLVARTRRHLSGLHRSMLNQYLGSIDATTTSITLAFDTSSIAVGSYISIEDELMYVQSKQNTPTVTVMRGMLGSTPAAHNGTITPLLVEIQPRFPTFAIRQAVQDEIRSWSPRLFGVKSTNLLTNIGTRGYDIGTLLDANWIDVLDVRRSTNQSGLAYGYNALVKTWPRIPYSITRFSDSSANDSGGSTFPTDFPSGTALMIKANYYNTTVSIIYSVAMRPPDAFGDSVDLLATMGFDPSWADIAPYGAASRLLIGREAVRNITESAGESRKAGDVPPQAIAQVANEFKAFRDQRLNEASRTLKAMFPIKFKT